VFLKLAKAWAASAPQSSHLDAPRAPGLDAPRTPGSPKLR
jgi:hypothetical protein